MFYVSFYFYCECLTDANEHQDKFSDPALQLETVNVFGLNSKNLLNGCMVQNGFLQNNRMNITSNPLAETDEDKVRRFVVLHMNVFIMKLFLCLRVSYILVLLIFLDQNFWFLTRFYTLISRIFCLILTCPTVISHLIV